MECPKCRSEVVDWHFYCSNCHALVNDSVPRAGKSTRGLVERTGLRLLNLLAAVFIVGLVVLMARAINWTELVKAVRGEINGAIEAKEERGSPAKPSTNRPPTSSISPKRNESSGRAIKSGKPESVRSLQQKIEELPSLDDPPKPSNPAPNPKPESVPLTSLPELAPAPNPVPVRSLPVSLGSLKEGTELGVERLEVKQSGDVGYIAIDSYVPARIYVNGQFSGLTPRTVKLSAGDHQIRLIAEGYVDWTRRIKLKSTEQIGIKAPMIKKVAQ